jgi:hypothetical protein
MNTQMRGEDHVDEPPRATPVVRRPDVLVVGGGAAGIAAATAAARAGASTLLVERYGFLGGTLTAVTLGTLCGGYAVGSHGTIKLVGGICDEIVERLMRAGAALPPRRWLRNLTVPYDPPALRRIADEFLADAGVEVLLHTLVVGAQVEGGRVRAAFVENKAGRGAIVPRIVIDCSGDGDLAAQAGAVCTVGENGATQFASTMFRFANVDVAAFGAIAREARGERLQQAVADGYDLPRTSAGLQVHPIDGVVHANVTRVKRADGGSFDLLDPWELGDAEREGRRQAALYEDVLRRYMPGFGNARIVDVGAHIGIRETRLVAGDRTLTEADVRGCVKPADAIACCAWPLEMHGADRGTVWDFLPEDDWYGVPYGCLVAKGFDNMLVAGRNLSATHAAQASVRVAATCMALGEAAGTAAALALHEHDDIRRFDVGLLRARLQTAGAILDPVVPAG